MKKMLILMVVLLCVCSLLFAQEWYQGGTLHKSTVKEWRYATYSNKLATCSDWLSATRWKGALKRYSDLERLKKASIYFLVTVDEAITDLPQIDNMKINEIAVALLTMTDDFDPKYY